MILEAGEFVDDNHAERPRLTIMRDKPGDVFAVNHRHHRRLRERVQPVCFGADSHRHRQSRQVAPLCELGRPGVTSHP